MKLPAFDYALPATIEEAVSLLASRSGNAKVISGGQSLVPMLAFRLAAPALLVDLKRLQGLNRIVIAEDGVRLGAKVRWCAHYQIRVVSEPSKKSDALSIRRPCGPMIVSSASQVIAIPGISAAGSACASEPPTVPRFRIW